MSYLVATNACNLGWDMSYLVATNAKVLETKDKDKCLKSRNKLGKAMNPRPTHPSAALPTTPCLLTYSTPFRLHSTDYSGCFRILGGMG